MNQEELKNMFKGIKKGDIHIDSYIVRQFEDAGLYTFARDILRMYHSDKKKSNERMRRYLNLEGNFSRRMVLKDMGLCVSCHKKNEDDRYSNCHECRKTRRFYNIIKTMLNNGSSPVPVQNEKKDA